MNNWVLETHILLFKRSASMKTSPKKIFVLGAIIANMPAFAQDLPRPTLPAPVYDPQQLPAYRGEVQQFTLTPRGDIDGMILKDGTEVKTSPHLSTELAYSVRLGDKVTIHGLRAAALPLVKAISVTDEADGRTVTDSGPAHKRGGPGFNNQEVQGRVKMSLHGPEGEVNGVLLDDGTVLRLPPFESFRLTGLIKPGQTIFAQGNGFASIIGRVIEVSQIGPSRDQLTALDSPREYAKKKP
jgi:hypothetical protein